MQKLLSTNLNTVKDRPLFIIKNNRILLKNKIARDEEFFERNKFIFLVDNKNPEYNLYIPCLSHSDYNIIQESIAYYLHRGPNRRSIIFVGSVDKQDCLRYNKLTEKDKIDYGDTPVTISDIDLKYYLKSELIFVIFNLFELDLEYYRLVPDGAQIQKEISIEEIQRFKKKINFLGQISNPIFRNFKSTKKMENEPRNLSGVARRLYEDTLASATSPGISANQANNSISSSQPTTARFTVTGTDPVTPDEAFPSNESEEELSNNESEEERPIIRRGIRPNRSQDRLEFIDLTIAVNDEGIPILTNQYDAGIHSLKRVLMHSSDAWTLVRNGYYNINYNTIGIFDLRYSDIVSRLNFFYISGTGTNLLELSICTCNNLNNYIRSLGEPLTLDRFNISINEIPKVRIMLIRSYV